MKWDHCFGSPIYEYTEISKITKYITIFHIFAKIIVIMSKKKAQQIQPIQSTPEPTKSKISQPVATEVINTDLLFGRKNYILMIAGIGSILLGYVLMSGGSMPSPDVWDESLIYSHRRITLAPILILAGFVLQIVAIFTKKD
jgi:hypothetical protein